MNNSLERERCFEEPCRGKNNHFEILTGQELDVCQAYKKRLEATRFVNPPYCDRLDNADVEGFTPLKRIDWNVEQIYQVYDRVSSFKSSSNQYFNEKIRKSSALGSDKVRVLYEVSHMLGRDHLRVWTYDPPLDINNDGQLDNVLFWKQDNRCRWPGNEMRNSYGGTVPFIFADRFSVIDEESMNIIFASKKSWSIPRFKFLSGASAMNAFEYQRKTYFDNWPRGYFYGEKELSKVDAQVCAGVYP